VAALFTVMTKVGVYAVLRVYTLVFGSEAGALAGWAWDWLLPAGLARWCWPRSARWRRDPARAGGLPGDRLGGDAVHRDRAGDAGHGRRRPVLPGAQHLRTAALFLVADHAAAQRGAARDRLDQAAPVPQAALLGGLFLVARSRSPGCRRCRASSASCAAGGGAEGQAAWVWSAVLATSLMAIVALARAGHAVLGKALRSRPPGIFRRSRAPDRPSLRHLIWWKIRCPRAGPASCSWPPWCCCWATAWPDPGRVRPAAALRP
jgi:multicomponent K+:H+ antiporter subunit D